MTHEELIKLSDRIWKHPRVEETALCFNPQTIFIDEGTEPLIIAKLDDDSVLFIHSEEEWEEMKEGL